MANMNNKRQQYGYKLTKPVTDSLSVSYSSVTKGRYSNTEDSKVLLTTMGYKVADNFHKIYESINNKHFSIQKRDKLITVVSGLDSIVTDECIDLLERNLITKSANSLATEWAVAKWSVGEDGMLSAYLVSDTNELAVAIVLLSDTREQYLYVYPNSDTVAQTLISDFLEADIMSDHIFKG